MPGVVGFGSAEGVELFHAAKAIATERIRRRDARLASSESGYEPIASQQAIRSANERSSFSGSNALPGGQNPNTPFHTPSNVAAGVRRLPTLLRC